MSEIGSATGSQLASHGRAAAADVPPHARRMAADLQTRLMVGLEIHVELSTRSKMFTAAPNVAHPDHLDAGPNTLTDPVVLGLPGALPVINREAVELSMLVGLALGCEIARVTRWDRKSYYYPDLPKNYQISQYDQPICGPGVFELPVSETDLTATKPIRITRAHLEEDAGKLMHEAPGGGAIDHSIVDLNRAGTPLLEIVTEPDFSSAAEVVRFAQELRRLCRALGVTEGVMQRGHMRFEPNINVVIGCDGREFATPIVEIKNLNSFKAVGGAVAFELERQVEAWRETGEVMAPGAKTTRGWDDVRGVTLLQREKEDAHDYRYFPDPDLPPVVIDEVWLDRVRARLVEPPFARGRRYRAELGLSEVEATSLIDEPGTADLFDAVVAEGVAPKRAAAMLLNYLAKRANERGVAIHALGVTAPQLATVAAMAEADEIGSSAADELIGLLCDADDPGSSDARELAERRGLLQVSDSSALEGFVDTVLADPKSAKAVDDIKAGKDKAIGAVIGQVMKLSKGQANPKLIREIVIRKLRG